MYFFPGDSQREAFAKSSAAVLDAIQIVGKEQISDGLWSSDHFGLLASFSFDDDEEKKETENPGGETSKRERVERSSPAKKGKNGSTKDSAVEIE